MKTPERFALAIGCLLLVGSIALQIRVLTDHRLKTSEVSAPKIAPESAAVAASPETVTPQMLDDLRRLNDDVQETCVRAGYYAGLRGATPQQLDDLVRAIRSRDASELARAVEAIRDNTTGQPPPRLGGGSAGPVCCVPDGSEKGK